ncbi:MULTISPECIES: aminotransferase class I/II-fold pyridoxal phosphate-dependent enzyme [Mycobacterium avium complex (MAC)]|uniref:Putative transcriptional regulatory protein ptsJ n=1 Tax=Mycobacterium indicus pranii (strain DSM 45239 / MTCC 9506) TaxID=1232724 RepID=J9WFY6_MYCIP|nr:MULTISPECIES: aminotransferase class I/II-fold pyridoxal phosphate-dependent enzyme [Mycobacterium avium complex (MAC)]AFS15073.1 Putative transcriptional regulatory protein ptsJ [Mycobacterium intracellulare subsp. intracellulare MTCC 9506]MCA2321626.1 aminotransferase class I/II-fold pyridoxal phosphate-dependent enzyme [Mycobacterium intracellulare]MDV6976449.1 aminotransferase class I/II-fold pyridoxal phosphate-dependent enzyme [Mycobacterium intracellulare]MDV6984578.1 aminotransferase
MPVQNSITGTGADSIAASIEAAISAGSLTPGDALPPVRELATQLGVNANTAAAAYRLLRDRGAVETAGRRGTRVRYRPATSPRSLLGLEVPAGVRDLSTGNPNPHLLPIAGAAPPAPASAAPVLYGGPAISAALEEFARHALTADGVPAEHLAVTSGALDGIERALTAHLRPGDRVAIEDPGWANLLDLLAALGLSAEPVRVDDDGPLTADLARALGRGVRALVLTNRAQNPTGAALSAQRAEGLREVLARRAEDLLVVEDDHCAGIAGVPLRTLAGCTAHWAFVRSASKAYGPDLRVAVLAGDHRTVERVHGRLRLGPGWVSHLLQRLAVGLWSDGAAAELVADAERHYADRRSRLCDALAGRGLDAHGRSGLNVWVPVPDEAVAISRLLGAGWAAAPGARFRMRTPAGIRLTISDLAPDEIDPLADAVAQAVRPDGRPIV